MTTYYLLLGATAMLVVIGLVMVLSASSVDVAVADDDSSYTVFLRPAALRRHRRDRRGSSPAGSPVRVVEAARRARARSGRCCCRSLVFTPLGVDRQRQPQLDRPRAGCSVQPSEFAKLGLVLVGAAVLASKRRQLGRAACTSSCRCLVPVGGRRCSGSCSSATTSAPRWSLLGDHRARVLFAAGVPTRCSSSPARRAGRARRRAMVAHQRQPDGPHLDLARRRQRRPRRRRLPAAATASTPSPTAAGGASASAPAGRSGSGCPRRTTTSSSRSSARSSACPARSWCSACSRRSRWPATGSSRAPTTSSSASPPPASWRGSLGPGDHQHRRGHRRCCRSSACRCRWSPPAGRPSSTTLFGARHAAVVRPQRAGLPEALLDHAVAWSRRSLAVLPAPSGDVADADERRDPSSVLLAGGGTAGHVSPLLALADCLRRRDPDVRITALGTETGLESRLVPGARLPAAHHPQGAAAAPPDGRPAAAARQPARAPSSRPARPSTRPAPRSSSASAATSRPRPTSPPGAARVPDRRPRAERPARPGQPARAPG